VFNVIYLNLSQFISISWEPAQFYIAIDRPDDESEGNSGFIGFSLSYIESLDLAFCISPNFRMLNRTTGNTGEIDNSDKLLPQSIRIINYQLSTSNFPSVPRGSICGYCLSLNFSYSRVCLFDKSTGWPLMNICLTFVRNSRISPSVTTRFAILPVSMLPTSLSAPNICAG
jgi:hypothetical protein